jgi:hypothetical protein
MFELVVRDGRQLIRWRCKFFLACIFHKLEQDLMGHRRGVIQMDGKKI